MAVALPRAMTTRPYYMEQMFSQIPRSPSEHTPSLHSSKSSISCSSSTSSYDLRAAFNASRPLTPYVEEPVEASSIHSKRSFLSFRRFRFGFRLKRPNFSQAIEMTPDPIMPDAIAPPMHLTNSPPSRRPSLPKLNADFPPPRCASSYAKKPLPSIPRAMAQEVPCRRCYYFAARNCNGWVMGGTNGDACETCLASGFFGAK